MITMSRRQALKGTAATLAVLSFPMSARADEPFRFITPFTFSLSFSPVLYAQAAGYFEAEGLAIEIEAGKGAALASQMTIARRMDSGRTGGTNYIVSRINDSAPLISIGTIAQLSPFFIISSKQNPVETIADLADRTVGMASLGGSMEGTLDLMMSKAGISPDTVNKVKVADSAASFALVEAGRAGAYIGNTSSMITASMARDDVFALPIDDGIPGQVYVAHPDEIAANPQKFVKFLRATHRAALEIATSANLVPILETIGAKNEVAGLSDMATAQKDLKANADNWIAKGQENLLRNVPEVWDNAVKLLKEANLIKEAVPADTLYTNTLLDEALSA